MIRKLIVVIGGLGSIAYGTSIMQMPEYTNVITQIQEIHGASSYSLILQCEQQDPIITFSPASYQESMDDEIYRSFMPGTTIADGVSDSSGVTQQMQSGVEIVLLGHLKEKIVGDHTIILTVEV